MTVPRALRDTQPNRALALGWILSLTICQILLYQLCFNDSIWFLLFGAPSPPLPSRELRLLVFCMSLLRGASQMIWGLWLSPYSLPIAFSIVVSLTSLVLDAVAILAVFVNRMSAGIEFEFDGPIFSLFVFGLLLERVSEVHRLRFKANLDNKGKMHVSGLHRYVVHPNYLGFLIARAAFFALSKFWPMQAITLLLAVGLVRGDIKDQRSRNIAKYGDEFKLYWDTTPKLVPGLF